MFQRTPCSYAACVLSVLLGLQSGCRKSETKAKKEVPPSPVVVVEAVRKPVPVEIRTFGTIEPCVSVTIRSQVTGILTKINFKEGQDVKKDDLLFNIDSIPMESNVKQAEATLDRDRVQHINAQKEAQRQDELLKKGLTSQDACDQARTAAEALAATVKADDANVESTKTLLGYCTIRSPLDGRTGRHLIDEGNLVKLNDTLLCTVNQVKPIKAGFSVPENNLGEITRQMAAGKLEVRAILPDEPNRPECGILTFVDNTVDRTTGTINLRATFPNEDGRLWPGQFVTLSLVLSVQQDALVIPSQAVQTGQKGTYVFIVKPDKSTENRPVKVARQADNLTVIEEGLQPGEPVVIEGQQRLGPGTRVEVRTTSTNAPAAKP